MRSSEVLTSVIVVGVVLATARVPLRAVTASLEGTDARQTAVIENGLLVDEVLGERVALPRRAQRIVSLTLASDVMLASLVSSDRVAGVTALVDDPSYSIAAGHYPPEIPRVTASAEALLALVPDLVVVSGYSHPATVRALVGAGVTVLRLPSGRTLDEVRAALVLLAAALGAEERAAGTLAHFDEVRAGLASRRAEHRPRALFYGVGGFTHGAGTLTDELLSLAGLENVARERGLGGLSRIGAEVVAASAPELVVMSAPREEAARETLARAGLAEVLAETPVIALPSLEIDATGPECIEAALHLSRALATLGPMDPPRRSGPP